MRLKIQILFFFLAISFDLSAVEYKIFQFKTLFHQLGYPAPTYFGSNQDEIDDLGTYISKEDTFYKEINNFLRYFPKDYEWNGIGPDDAQKIVFNIDRIFNRTPYLPQDLILFRGIDLSYRKNKSFMMGEEILEKGYMSTSTSLKTAMNFGKAGAVLVLYQNLPDQKGILIDEGEDEVILKHHRSLKIMSKKKTQAGPDFYLVELCEIKCTQVLNSDIKKFWEKFKVPAYFVP